MLIEKSIRPLFNETNDPSRRSWVGSANEADAEFPIQNLPFGIFDAGDGDPRFGIAIGDRIVDMRTICDLGLLSDDMARAVDSTKDGNLNGLFGLGRMVCSELRRNVSIILDADREEGRAASEQADRFIHPAASCRMHLPVNVRNYSDFYAGIHHARAVGTLFTPEAPLPENYKWVPIAYHGRASSVRASGGSIRRPCGQRHRFDGPPTFGPSEKLDLELELGCFIGCGNDLGEPIPISEASQHAVGLCLLNDWSARDFQRWEMQPLGPFLGKSFSTTISPWVVTIDALEPFRVPAFARPEDDPPPLDYLHHPLDVEAGGFDIELSVLLRTARMKEEGRPAETIIVSNARHLYWTVAQMIAHHSSGGCNLLSGDLIGTGTISGPRRDELSSLLELTYDGRDPITFANGEVRTYLVDGDEVTLTAKCRRQGFRSIGFGRAVGTIVP
jgi:fumarylacetoacetase